MIEELENDQHILLMYLAGELPAEDRLQVERRLAVEPALGAQLEQLRADHDAVGEAITRLDELSTLGSIANSASLRAGRQITARLIQRAVRDHQQTTKAGHAGWRWVLPTAAAAAILVSGGVWIARQVNNNSPTESQQLFIAQERENQLEQQEILEGSFQSDLEREQVAVSASKEPADDAAPLDPISRAMLGQQTRSD